MSGIVPVFFFLGQQVRRGDLVRIRAESQWIVIRPEPTRAVLDARLARIDGVSSADVVA